MTQLTLSPGQVLVTGVLGVALWTSGLYFFADLDSRELVLVISAGGIGAVSGTAGAIIQAVRSRSAGAVLARTAHDATHDALTDLPNRNALFERLDDALARAKETDTVVGVLFLDLNRFKAINDSMGHEAGDELLRIVAERLLSSVRGSDVVARFGGDEFVVVVRDLLNERSVLAVVEQILRAFDKQVSLFGGSQVISTSIGVAIARPDDDRRSEDLVRDADAAMYRAKRSRSGYAVFDEVQRRQVMDRLGIERDLIAAIEEGQFAVYYQPLVNVAERKLFGFEALVRWEHPTRGLIGPSEFLPVAEETGMMSRIGDLVLREATAQAAVWNHLNPEASKVKMTVNLAEQQLLDANFPELLREVLAWSGLPAEQLALEISAEAIDRHVDGFGVLERLRDIGVELAVDDFGTGNSSLSYANKFDMISMVKIDRTVVSEMGYGDSNRAIVEAIVAMAGALDVTVVAEGVEDRDQVNQLLDVGVNVMQGFLFNAPLPADGIDPSDLLMPTVRSRPTQVGLSPLEVSRGLASSGSDAER